MEITIVGWYGTETIGDRAILAGIFRILSETIGTFSVKLGSLFPFYSQRTLLEDIDFYKIAANNNELCIRLFDSRNPFELKDNIKHSDMLMVGGGPLMDIEEMSMLDVAFTIASQYKIMCVLMGCGWGPLKTDKAISIAKKLVNTSDLVIFRDKLSKEQAEKNGCNNNIFSIIDPAVIACSVYLESSLIPSKGYVSINLRDIKVESRHYLNKEVSLDIFIDIVRNILSSTQLPIHLVPMHNFFIGGDDRIILNKIAHIIDSDRVTVIQRPLSLKQTMDEFHNSAFCVGMRFHSILLQTILNGKNYIVDYTDPNNGKIVGLMKTLRMEGLYNERYLSLSSTKYDFKLDVNQLDRFLVSNEVRHRFLLDYCELVSRMFKC